MIDQSGSFFLNAKSRDVAFVLYWTPGTDSRGFDHQCLQVGLGSFFGNEVLGLVAAFFGLLGGLATYIPQFSRIRSHQFLRDIFCSLRFSLVERGLRSVSRGVGIRFFDYS